MFDNFSVNSLQSDLSNDTTVNPPLFSLVNTFKASVHINNITHPYTYTYEYEEVALLEKGAGHVNGVIILTPADTPANESYG